MHTPISQSIDSEGHSNSKIATRWPPIAICFLHFAIALKQFAGSPHPRLHFAGFSVFVLPLLASRFAEGSSALGLPVSMAQVSLGPLWVDVTSITHPPLSYPCFPPHRQSRAANKEAKPSSVRMSCFVTGSGPSVS